MELVTLIEQFGVWGLIAFGLGVAVVALWKQLISAQNARIDDHKEHTAQIIENVRTLDRALEVVRRQNGS
jgi:hypothetical protein